MPSQPREPMLNISEPAPLYLSVVLITTWGIAQLLGGRMLQMVERYTVLRPYGVDEPSAQGISLLGHAFAHGDFMHVGMNSLFITIFGIAIIRAARLRGNWTDRKGRAVAVFLAIFMFGVVAGGLGQWLEWSVMRELNSGAVGASGGASALFAAAGFVMGGRALMFRFALGWAIINVVMVMSAGLTGANIAWAAHMGGYVGGMILAPVLLAYRRKA